MTDRSEGDVNLGPARIAWRRDHVDAATGKLLDADAAVFLHQALSTPCLEVIESAEGVYLTTASGRRIMDFHGNSVHQLGYGHPRVAAAMTEQLAQLPFSPRRFTNRAAIDLATRLTELAPGRLSRVLFAPAGTLAIGMALKLARIASGRHKTVSMWDSFHGASLDAISVGGEAIFRRGIGPLMAGTEHVPPPGLAPRFFGTDRPYERLADYIDYVLGVEGDVAAVIAEPMRWTSVEPPPPGFWPLVRAACDRHGTKLIFDEVPSALGRTGTMFVTEQTGCEPDMLVLGKGLGGGVFPLAALIARDDLNVAGDGALGHYTHEKSSIGCAVGLATLDAIRDEGLVVRSATLGAAALERLRALLEGVKGVRDVRGVGLYLGVELDDPAAAEAAMYRCLADGLSFKVGGGTVLTLCPPLTIAEAELDRALGIVARAVGGRSDSQVTYASAPVARALGNVLPAAMPEQPLPIHMKPDEVTLLHSLLACSHRYLEFGAGGSTCLAAQTVSQSVVCVDSSQEWLDRVAAICAEHAWPVQPVLLHADIGPLGRWGSPADPATRAQWPDYHTAVWSHPAAAEVDTVMIDGRFRVACFMQAMLRTRADTVVIVHDFAGRENYASILRVAREVARTGTLSAFIRRRDFDAGLATRILNHARFNYY